MYLAELEIKYTADNDHRASHLDLDQSYDRYKRLQVKLYDKRDDFNLNIMNFPFSSTYGYFLVRSRLLTNKLLGQGYKRIKLITTFKKFYGRHYDLIGEFQISVTHMIIDLFLET